MFFFDDDDDESPEVGFRGIPGLNLAALAGITVPAHGLVMVRGATGNGGFIAAMTPWLKRLLGAVGIASMIALGLFVYTEFTGAWTKRGLPAIPISALAALEMPRSGEVSPQSYPRGQPPAPSGRQQKLELFNDYVG